tara:strand:+ start:756 stop:902 length:147 start_codon:yes stop_codon:yes gene_type:complete
MFDAFGLYRLNRATEDRKRQTVERIKERARERARQTEEEDKSKAARKA